MNYKAININIKDLIEEYAEKDIENTKKIITYTENNEIKNQPIRTINLRR